MEASPSLVYGASLLMKLGAIPRRFESCCLRVTNEEEKALRAKIANDIRADLVCCNMYDTVQEVDKVLRGRNIRVWEPETVIRDYHAICHWGECAARIAEHGPEGNHEEK